MGPSDARGSEFSLPKSPLPEPPFSTRLLADFHADALDPATDAHVRARLAADPNAPRVLDALNRVQSDLRAYGQTAPPMPNDVAARIDKVIDDLT
ncbi:hypothetical protein [Gordonia sp. (in: high G+C Gram-positive bacteria)]|uniref:hypothetical protein n=1 Tax=Gordonia sp. (in: high G+C Gram-positive bacteria) TaxID=84139 RepID=UPI003C722504